MCLKTSWKGEKEFRDGGARAMTKKRGGVKQKVETEDKRQEGG